MHASYSFFQTPLNEWECIRGFRQCTNLTSLLFKLAHQTLSKGFSLVCHWEDLTVISTHF